MPALRRCAAFVVAVAGLTTAVTAQTFVEGVAFLDRAARGEITLGGMRGSIGVIDIDNDGWYDLFLPDIAGQNNRLFRNVASASTPGGRTFQDITIGSGIDDAEGTARAFGPVVVFDYDNDGDSDIYTAGFSSNTSGLLYRNNGDSTFTNVSVAAGVRLTSVIPDSASVNDFDHDGDLDLFIAAVSSPGRTLTLLSNNSDGTFSDRSVLLPSVSFTGRIYAHAWTDFDQDGWEDALVCLNAGVPLCLRNVPNPSGGRMLVNATAESGFTSIGPAPMGIAMGDHDGDGDLDVAITDAATGTYFNNVGGMFVRVSPFTTFFGWGTTWIDADNDARLDNYQAGSWGAQNIDFLLLNRGNGVWTDARPALNTTAIASQYCAKIDYDNDGREDIITINPTRFVSVYHNQSQTQNHWSKIRLVTEPTTNRDAIGAIVRLTAGGITQVREIISGSSFAATEDPRAHFGLGTADRVDRIEVVWPRAGSLGARTERFEGPFDADTILTLTAAPAPCTGDANNDQMVTFEDITTVLATFGASYSPGTGLGDADFDGVVAFADISQVLSSLGSLCPAVSRARM